MIFGILFIVAFLVGLAIYLFTNRWLLAVGIPSIAFVLITLLDTSAESRWQIVLVFGTPIMFFGSLLGTYVVELRRGVDEGAESESPDEPREEKL